MKTILFLFISLSVFGQRDTLYLKSIYQDASVNLVSEKVIRIDSVSQSQLLRRFENWAGTHFRNYDEVRTSKTESQVTLLYITSSFGLLDMYQQMTVDFKDNEIRISVYDDGNVYKPGSYSGTYHIPAIASRSYRIKNYFRDEDDRIIYKVTPAAFNIKEKQATGAINYKRETELTLVSIEASLKSVTGMTSDEALAELKRAKDKLDLQLITQDEYDRIKAELAKYIK